ncbi:MAG: DUF11 domain-containing protein [Chloroflexi bacterium]|nr:DUF11 domain-containing protein [Chloroflexota bacterium]
MKSISLRTFVFKRAWTFFLILLVVTPLTLAQTPTAVSADKAGVCGTPGYDGPAATLSGVVNSYYPGTGNPVAGATSIPVGTARTGGGAAIAAGDLLLVVQMQGADIDASNDQRYGSGVGTAAVVGNTVPYTTGEPQYAGGNVAANYSAGLYEYVVATGPVSAGSVPISSSLVNSYFYSNNTGGASQGQRRYQVVRIPQYSSATLNGTVTALRWDGSTGGIVAFDVAGELNWNGYTVDVSALGFRGGGGRQLAGGAGANTDYRTLSTVNANGAKGEGYAGTPRYLNDNGALLNNTVEGYPSGSFGRGAAGNGGGGSTDGNPANNDQNSGGGGGGNGGYGGMGGNAWSSGLVRGGFGGAPFGGSAPRLILGGGGGAGTTNNGTGSPGAGFASSGAAGGGVVMIRAGTIIGAGTINANGATANQTVLNDGGGGGGAGGSVVVIAKDGSGSVGTLTVTAVGGNGGLAWPAQTAAIDRHGPGGGGGGGFVYTSGAVTGSSSVAGGSNGTTINPPQAFGATPGGAGVLVTNVTPASIPDSISGANCVPVSLNTTKSTSTPSVPAGSTATYTITVSNAVGAGGASGVSISDDLPTGFEYVSTNSIALSGSAARTATSNPPVGTVTPAWGTFMIPGGGSVQIIFTVNVIDGTPLGTYQNPATATFADPVRTGAATLTSSYDPVSSSAEDVTVTAGPPAIAKSFSPDPILAGGTSVLTFTITNPNSGTALSGVAFSDSLPAAPSQMTVASPTGVTISGCGTPTFAPSVGASSLSFSGGTIAAGGTCVVTVNVTASTAGTYNNTSGAVSSTEGGTGNTSSASLTLNTAPTGCLPNQTLVTWNFDALALGTNTAPAYASKAGDVLAGTTVAAAGSGLATSTIAANGNSNPNNWESLSDFQAPIPANSYFEFTVDATKYTGLGMSFAMRRINTSGPTTVNVQYSVDGGSFVSFATHTNIPNGAYVTNNEVFGTALDNSTSNIRVRLYPSGATNNSRVVRLDDVTFSGCRTIQPPSMTKAFSPTSIPEGGVSTLTFTLSNANTLTALTGAAFSDNYPTNVVNAATPAVNNSCGGTVAAAAGDGGISLVGGTIPANGTCVISVNVTSATAGTYVNTSGNVSSLYGGTGTTPATSTLTVTAVADLGITKTDERLTVVSGQQVTYTLVITNTGTITATGVELKDTISSYLTYGSSTCGTPSINGYVYTWGLADIAAGASTSCTVTATVAGSLSDGTQIVNYAHISTTASEPNITNNEVSDIDTVQSTMVPDLQVTKTHSHATPLLAGDTITYTIAYTNAGQAATTGTGVVITDNLPSNASYVSSDPAGTLVGSTLTWNVGNLGIGASGSIEVVVTANSSLLPGAVVLNRVSIASPDGIDYNLMDNSATDSDVVVAPYVVIEKSVTGDSYVSGVLTYTIHWQNISTADAASVIITDVIPANTTLVPGSISSPGSEAGSTITWNLGTEVPGASGDVSFQVTIDNVNAGGDSQTGSTLSVEAGAGSVTVISKTSAYTSLPWCDSVYNPDCLTYTGIYQGSDSVGATGWNDNPRATVFDDTSWMQPYEADAETAYWLNASVLSAEWTSVHDGHQLPGTVDVTNGNATVTGTGTNFTGELAAGRFVTIGGTDYEILTISSATSMTLTTNYAGATATGLDYYTDGEVDPNYAFYRQAFCTPLNASNLDSTLSLSSDDTSFIYLNGVSLGQHTGAGAYTTFSGADGIQPGINILSVRLQNNTHGGHSAFGGADHSGVLFNLQASYSSLRPFASAPSMILAGQTVTFTIDENALGGRTPYNYKVDFGDGTSANYQLGSTFNHTYNTSGVYNATVTARAEDGCTGTDQVTINALETGTPVDSRILGNTASVSYSNLNDVPYSGQSGAGTEMDMGTLTGVVYNDTVRNGIFDDGELGLSGVTVTLRNSLGQIVASVQTDVNGVYSFSGLASGTYSVTETDPSGYNSTGDTEGANDNVVGGIVVAAGVTTSDNNFFDAEITNNPTISTIASPTTGETGIAGTFGDTATVSGGDNPTGSVTFTLYSDSICTTAVSGMSGSGVISGGEASWSSSWTPPLAGTYYWKASYPGDINNNPYTTGCLDANEQITITDPPRNFGHLPYPTYPSNLLGEDGAWSLTGDTYLGDSVTTATDGVNEAVYTPKASDDGVTNTPDVLWAVGANGGSMDLIITCPSGPCYLNGWMDFNQNGTINNYGEQIFTNLAVSAGNITRTFDIPSGTVFDGSRIYSRFRLTTQPMTDPQPNGVSLNGPTVLVGEIEDIYFEVSADGTTTPVTLSYFKAERQDDLVNFNWSTATETGNIGFNLYAIDGNGARIRLNPGLIPSNSVNSLDRQDYTYGAATTGDIFYIEDISILRDTRLHGPFTLGEEYGAQVNEDKIDWALIQDQHNQAQTDHQNSISIDMAIPAIALEADLENVAEESSVESQGDDSALTPDIVAPDEAQPDNTLEISPEQSLAEPGASRFNLMLTTTLNLKVRQSGLYRVTYEMLRDAGLELSRVASNRITLTNRGKEQPIYMQAGNTFGPGSYLEFYGQALDTIYTDTNIYTLQISRKPIGRIPLVNDQPAKGQTPPNAYSETLVVNNQRAYANYAPGHDAWYDTEMLAFTTPKSWNFPFQINGLANSSASTMELSVWGVTDWPQDSDHHLKVSVNGIALADEIFDGLVEKKLRLNLSEGALHEGTNTLQLTLPGDSGVEAELIALDQFSVTYPRAFIAQNGRLTFTAAGDSFRVSNLPSRDVIVYRMDKNGLARFEKVRVQASGGTFSVSFAGSSTSATYLVTTAEAMHVPSFEAVRQRVNLNRPAEYLIIAHPDFMDGVQPLVQAHQAQGMTVSVVDVTDLYTQYSHGVFDPQAIQKYIAYAVKNLGTQYVLLVGGDTYDYRNHLGVNSLSFIPSLYAKTGAIANFVPSDALYADLDQDNVPDVAIGRFPVRNVNELNLMVNKTLAYGGKEYGQTSVFASDRQDGAISFKAISDGLASGLPTEWRKENIHLDELSVNVARSQLIEAMNRGTALVTFTGHSGPQEWTFSNLFNIGNAATLTNAGRPFVVVQWGCWNTYYVDPIYNYLVQSFLLSGDRGAAAVLGATTLADSDSEQLLGQLLTPRLTQPGMMLGQALLLSKKELAQTHPGLLDVMLGWSLMGDPALVIEP